MVLHFLRDERGSTAIEYALIAALICTAVISGVTLWSDRVVAMFDGLSATFDSAT